MQIALADRSAIRGDFVVRAVQRFDLTPVPSTLELVLKSDPSLGGRIVDGGVILAGTAMDRYRVVKLRRSPSEWAPGKSGPIEVIELTCVLEAFYPLADPLRRAVVKEGRSLGEIYRSCGASVRVTDDISVPRFACFVGDFATPHIARVLQEEAAAPVWTSEGVLRITRLPDLFSQRPVSVLAKDNTLATSSDFLERHETPRAVTAMPDGSIVVGGGVATNGYRFLSRAQPRVLENMRRCLMTRRALDGQYAPAIRAGDAVDMAGIRHVVVTAAHQWVSGADGGPADQTTRLWLAQLQR